MKKNYFVFLLAMLISIASNAEIASGTCGDNASWTLSDDYTLTISGTGDMTDYDYAGEAPWYSYRTNIKSVVIQEGITTIGKRNFINCSGINNVIFPSSLKYINYSAFEKCTNIQTLRFPNVLDISGYAFSGCEKLEVVYYDNTTTLNYTHQYAFESCSNLSAIYCSATNTRYVPRFANTSYSDNLSFSRKVALFIPKGYSSIYRNNSFSIMTDGYIGNSAYLNLKGKNVYVYGSGTTKDYTSSTNAPIPSDFPLDSIFIEEGITSIGAYTFCTYPEQSLAYLSLPSSLSKVGDCAFGYRTLSKVECFASNPPTAVSTAFTGCKTTNSTLYVPSASLSKYQSASVWSNFGTISAISPYKASGTCGESLTWTLSKEGILTISGTGDMTNYTVSTTPWNDYLNQIKSIKVENGVTSIGYYAFASCSELTSVQLPNSITSLSIYAFGDCIKLTNINIPNTVTSIEDGALAGCSALTNITLPEGITSIGSFAFNGCIGLTNIDIPSTVTSIGDDAFEACSSLKSITIPNGVTTIKSATFNGCSSLENITIPNSVTKIEAMAFCGCSSLTSVVFDGKVSEWNAVQKSSTGNAPLLNANITYTNTDIASGTCGEDLTWTLSKDYILTISGTGEMANYTELSTPWYEYNDQINSVILSEGITSLGNFAFAGLTNITNITIPQSVSSIGEGTFSNCSALNQFELPSTVTDIGWCAFYGVPCEVYNNLIYAHCPTTMAGNYVLPNAETVLSILPYAFDNCTEITGITIPSGITRIEDNTFSYCSSLASIEIPEGITEINSCAFSNCSNLANVTIPASVTKIGSFAFDGCSSLTSVIFDGKVSEWNAIQKSSSGNAPLLNANITYTNTEIASGTCGENLTWTLLKEGVLAISGIGEMANYTELSTPWYEYNDQINSVVLSEGITSLGNFAFAGLSTITNITIPQSVSSIGEGTFSNCSALNQFELPITVTDIDWCAFYGVPCEVYNNLIYAHCPTTMAGDYVLPNAETVLSILPYAFDECTGITGVIIPSGITKIEDNTFSYCSSLVSVEIPEGITEICSCAFSNCSNLTNVTIPASVTKIGSFAFSNCSGLTNIIIPSTVISIGNDAFEACSSLKNIIIPNGVTTIKSATFNGCSSLESITIPNSVTKIETMAFAGCKLLNNISCFATEIPSINSVDIKDVPTSCKLYVPASAYVDYTNAKVWNTLTIVGIENGDVNLSGSVNITDAVEVLNNVLGQPSEKFVKVWSDVNGDNQYTIADASAVINVILGEEIGTADAKSRSEHIADTDKLTFHRTNTNQLTLDMTNKVGYNAFQFDVTLPEDMSIDNIELNQLRCADFSVMFRETSAGHYTVAVFNFDNTAFATGSGSLLNIITSGNGNNEDVIISNIHFATTKATDILFENIIVEEATDINNINIANSIDGKNNIYDLSGRKFQNAKYGVYIINGKKKFIK